MWIRILLVTLMRIWISNTACHLQIDADPDMDPAYHFDANPDPDSTFQFDANPDPLQCL
jgi:hypothetical protein